MRRADRLYRLVDHLRGRRCVTAAQLAQWLEVSERTVYRDVRDLMASGVPIEGEAGVGYRLSRHHHLPPLMFSADELAALRWGMAMVSALGRPGAGRAGGQCPGQDQRRAAAQRRAPAGGAAVCAGFARLPGGAADAAAPGDCRAPVCRAGLLPRRWRAQPSAGAPLGAFWG